MIKLRHIRKEYIYGGKKVIILNDISYDFFAGKIYALVGESGSGKTTLLNILGLLDTDYLGSYRINGIPVDKQNINRFRNHFVAYVYQTPIMFNKLSYVDNINLPLMLSNQQLDKIVIDKTLKRFNLQFEKSTDVDKFSGGEIQRLSFCRGLLAKRKLLLLDEATSALDKANVELVKSELQKIKQNNIIILVTHDLSYAKQIADEIITIKDGSIDQSYLASFRKEAFTLPANQAIDIKHCWKLGFGLLKANYKRLFSFVSMLSGSIVGLCISLSLCGGFLDYFKKSINQEIDENLYFVSKKDNRVFLQKEIDYFSKQNGVSFIIKCDSAEGIICDSVNGKIFLNFQETNKGAIGFEIRYNEKQTQPYILSSSLYESLGEIKHLDLEFNGEKVRIVSSSDLTFISQEKILISNNTKLLDLLNLETDLFTLGVYSKRKIMVANNSLYLVTYPYQQFYEPLTSVIKGLKNGILIFGCTSIVISVLGIITIGLLDMLDRKKQIGLLRLQGWTRFDIWKMLAVELLVKGILTSFVSIIISYVGTYSMNQIFAQILGANSLTINLEIETIILIVGLTFLLMVIVGFFPFYYLYRSTITNNLH